MSEPPDFQEKSIAQQNAELLNTAGKDTFFVADKKGKLQSVGGLHRTVILIKNWFSRGKTLKAIDAAVNKAIANSLNEKSQQIHLSKVPERYQEGVGKILLKILAQQQTPPTNVEKEPSVQETPLTTDEKKLTDFFEACQRGDKESVETFLKSGAEVDAADEWGATPLHHGCMWGASNITELLISYGADINKKAGNETPLLLACRLNDIANVKVLLRCPGLLVDETDRWGRTPLMFAARFNQLEIVQKLLVYRANVNARTNDNNATPLIYACSTPDLKLDIVKALVEAGADSNAEAAGGSALCVAVKNQRSDIVNFLLENNASPDARDTFTGRTPLMEACFIDDENLVKVLLAKGADVGLRDNRGLSVLSYAQGNRAIESLIKEAQQKKGNL